MFFKYTWNNFLHTQVEICIALILASPFENADSGTMAAQDTAGDNLLLKHVSFSSPVLGAWLSWVQHFPTQGEFWTDAS